MCDYSSHWGSQPQCLLTWRSPSEVPGPVGLVGMSVSMLSSLFLFDDHVRVMLEETIIHHWRHHWHYHPLIMEEASPGQGCLLYWNHTLYHSSSFCTWSSQDMEEDQPSSMNLFEGHLLGLRYFHCFIPQGPRGCRQFSTLGA